jgi:hypothetical protein
MVVQHREAVAFSAIVQSLKILEKIRQAEENSNERRRQEEILASYQSCARELLS